MKQTFTFLFAGLLFFSAQLSAQPGEYRGAYNNTKFSLSSFYGSSLRVVVDGNTYNVENTGIGAELMLNNLSAGNHNVRVTRQGRRRGMSGVSAGTVLYESSVYLRAGFQTDLVINRFGRAFKDEMQIAGNPQNPVDPQYPSYNQPMSASSFNALKATLRNESFDNSRLNIAKQAAGNNYFSAAQVKEIMLLFSYDDSRYDIATTLYPRTTDKANYFTVNDAFIYSTTKDRLAAFIRDNP